MNSRETLWISHSAITDFNNCARLYYFKNVYRQPQTGNRVQIASPYLSLGSAVHSAIDELVNLSPSQRKRKSLLKVFEQKWLGYRGKRGGFFSNKQESEFKKRGIRMIKIFQKSTLLLKKSLKKEENLLKMELLPGVELVGSWDWIEIFPDNSLHIIDFKTGQNKEKNQSLQLPIYNILIRHHYPQKIKKSSYWYLERDPKPVPKKIENSKKALLKITEKAQEIKKAVENFNFSCHSSYRRCFWCQKYETILSGKAEYIDTDQETKKDIYYLSNGEEVIRKIYDEEFLNQEEKDILKMKMDRRPTKELGDLLEMTSQQVGEIVFKIKTKIKDNLSNRELKVFVEALGKNGK